MQQLAQVAGSAALAWEPAQEVQQLPISQQGRQPVAQEQEEVPGVREEQGRIPERVEQVGVREERVVVEARWLQGPQRGQGQLEMKPDWRWNCLHFPR